ncbi:MAG: hypothetical protein CVT89_05825 [Candidatus Altiarchaeales archaeon HGW-Altiarchaeales-2]|nr:MAG: hypothetical protein CVT89_05825 [Candidatus Altiarchaeales archaeon HGW-Altiarchaeales-2]
MKNIIIIVLGIILVVFILISGCIKEGEEEGKSGESTGVSEREEERISDLGLPMYTFKKSDKDLIKEWIGSEKSKDLISTENDIYLGGSEVPYIVMNYTKVEEGIVESPILVGNIKGRKKAFTSILEDDGKPIKAFTVIDVNKIESIQEMQAIMIRETDHLQVDNMLVVGIVDEPHDPIIREGLGIRRMFDFLDNQNKYQPNMGFDLLKAKMELELINDAINGPCTTGDFSDPRGGYIGYLLVQFYADNYGENTIGGVFYKQSTRPEDLFEDYSGLLEITCEMLQNVTIK